jgi:hypothetical protein
MEKKRIPPKPRQMSEATLQTKCVSWFDEEFKELHDLLYHNYNNPPNRIAGSRLKKQGLRKGIPDLSLAAGNLLYIENKTETGVLSDDQIKVHSQLKKAGFQVVVCRDLSHFKEIVINHLDGFTFDNKYSYKLNYAKNSLFCENDSKLINIIEF